MIKEEKANKILFKVIIFLSSFILLYPKFPLVNIPGTYVAVRIEDLLIGFTVLFWFVVNLRKYKQILSKTISQSMIVFWLVGLLSVISGALITFSVLPHLGVLHWLRRVEVMSLFFVAATVIKTRQQFLTLLKWLLAVNTLIIIYGFGQIYLGFPVISTTNREFSKGLLLQLTSGARVNSTFAGHYDLAIYLSIVVVLIGTLFFYFKNRRTQALLILSGLFSFALLGLTAARVSFVAAIAGLAFSFWYSGKRILIVALIIASIAVIGLVPQLRHRLVATITVNLLEGGGPKYAPQEGELTIFTPDNKVAEGSKSGVIKEATSSTASSKQSTISADIAPGEPINTTELGVYRSFNIRTDVEWPRAIRAFAKNPLLGTGYSSITIATDNDYLRALGETGILGTLALVLVFLIIIKRFLSEMNNGEKLEKLIIVSSLGMIFVVLITATFIDVLEASKIASMFWLMMGATWGLTEGMKERK